MGLDNENAAHAMTFRPWMAFDLETVPAPDCAEYLTEPIEAPSNWKDPVKIAKYITAERQQQINEAGLDLDLCEVVAIAGAFADREWCQSRQRQSEEAMIRDFWRFAANLFTAGGVLVGFNVLHFDLPVLLRRSLYLGIPTPRISIDKYRHDQILDVAELLSFGRRDLLRSQAFYAKRLGIAHDTTVDGSQIAALVIAGQWDTVERHCRMDTRTVREIAEVHSIRTRVEHSVTKSHCRHGWSPSPNATPCALEHR